MLISIPAHVSSSGLSPVMLQARLFNDTAPPEIYTLSLHDALPISVLRVQKTERASNILSRCTANGRNAKTIARHLNRSRQDRKSTRLNSSHLGISYAVFCLKKKKKRKIVDSARRTIRHGQCFTTHD